VHSEFIVRNSSIEILIHLSHDLINLLLRDSESESLKKVLELITLNEPVLVGVNLMENFSKREGFLVQNCHHMIEYLVLNIDLFPLMFYVLKCCFIVLIEETFEFHIFNEAILILIDFFEEFQEVLSF
jgi:hypothetical protein